MYTVLVFALGLIVTPLGLWLIFAGFGGVAILALWGGTIVLGLLGLIAKYFCHLREEHLDERETSGRQPLIGPANLEAHQR